VGAGTAAAKLPAQIPVAPGRLGAGSREPDNDFLFGTEDPQGLRCPLGAHIRRANPRESFHPGSDEQIEITNRHRIIRVGRFYQPEGGQRRGLFFMCLNGDIERQFEFVQQTWVDGSSFHGLSGERDPLTGERGGAEGHTIPIARVQAKRFDAARMWFEVVRDLPKGLPLDGDQGLDSVLVGGPAIFVDAIQLAEVKTICDTTTAGTVLV
jgi:hypothetical protein